MSLTVFHPFSRLPAELRWQIYLLATQPRFVHLRVESLVERNEHEEDEADEEDDDLTDFELFAARLAPWNLILDPSLTYFAHDWRNRIRLRDDTPRSAWCFQPRNPDRATQTLLTAYGFSTTKPRPQPWPPTQQHPEIPPHLLYTQPKAAWQMTRPLALYSAAPIPPLLHMCAESRQVLMRHGYELAFRTRSAGPRTWFCFRDDTLYLPQLARDWDDGEWYDNTGEDGENPGPCDLHPDDLVRVRRLALEAVYVGGYRSDTSRTLRLCPNVRELFAVQGRVSREERKELLYGCSAAAREEIERAENGGDDDELWEWIECDEADAAPRAWWGPDRKQMTCGVGLHCTGEDGESLLRWKRAHGGDSTGYFEGYVTYVEARLRQELEEVLQAERGEVKPWNIPSVKLVIVGTRVSIKAVYKARERYWLALQEEEEQEQERGVSPSNWVGNENYGPY